MSHPEQTPRIKVIVDTDIGNDPDDVLALAYLAKHPSCELLGVTIVTGDVQQRAAVAEAVLRTCLGPKASQIPIHCGRREPLLKGHGQPRVLQYETIKHLAQVRDRPENTAVDFMRRVVRENPGEVVLLTIGPLSNVALLFASDPEMPVLLKEVVSMCGKYLSAEEHGKEWNVLVDETAAGMVLKTKRPRHRFVGLDVTRACALKTEDFRCQFEALGELGKLLRLLAQHWLDIKGRVTFHDPVAAAMIFRPNLCQWKTGRVVVDGGDGGTSFGEGKGTDLVAAQLTPETFFDHFFHVIKGTT